LGGEDTKKASDTMHEMGIALEIIDIATASIPKDMKRAHVRRVNLNVGKLSSIVPDSLRFCFDIAAKHTPLEGAQLNITEIPVVAKCRSCSHEWIINGPIFTCERCHSGAVELLSGQELDIHSIELTDDSNEPESNE
jgi:hydrogenase nickel incorporation protein HypA/HybF